MYSWACCLLYKSAWYNKHLFLICKEKSAQLAGSCPPNPRLVPCFSLTAQGEPKLQRDTMYVGRYRPCQIILPGLSVWGDGCGRNGKNPVRPVC